MGFREVFRGGRDVMALYIGVFFYVVYAVSFFFRSYVDRVGSGFWIGGGIVAFLGFVILFSF